MLSRNFRARAVARALCALPFAFMLCSKSYAQADQATPQVFDIWAYSCAQAVCQVYTTLNDPESDELVVGWSFVQDPKTEAISAVMRLPLGPALPPGVMVRVDPDGALPAQFQTCNEDGCSVVLRLDDAFLAKLQAGTGISVEYVVYGETERKMVNAPLSGFADALDAMRMAAKP